MPKIAITSDCTCDLSDKILEEYDIRLIYFYMNIDKGCFKDTEEITASNVIEYLNDGGRKMVTLSPGVDEIYSFFQKQLENFEEVIHISISSKLSEAYEYALEAAKRCNGKVHVIDSEQISTGMGLLVIRAAELACDGKNSEEIIKEILDMKQRVSMTFIMNDVECFCRTKRCCGGMKYIVNFLHIHPVITIKKGKLVLKGIHIGNFEKSVLNYVKKALDTRKTVNDKMIFITHSNVKVSLLGRIKQQIKEKYNFRKIHITKASATVCGNCGANTIGVLFVSE